MNRRKNIGFVPHRRAEKIIPLGIYVHIPFCRKKCQYCDFYSLPTEFGSEDEMYDRYESALIKHITENSARTSSTVDSIYFGGGTPTVFGASRLVNILKTIKKTFKVSHHAEITIEANPESSDIKTLRRLKRAGFNRFSLGVQSCSDYELSLLGRIHTGEQAKQAFYNARKAGFDDVSVDLMYGIEKQTLDSWKKTLNEILSWNPEHISAYGLKVEEGTPLALRASEAELADDDQQADMYLAVCEILRNSGFEHYEISNWAKRGRESRHNLRYWRLEPYIGFGPAAHSDCFGARYSAVRNLESYMRGVEQGGAVLDEYEEIPASNRAGEYMMLSLRTSDGLSLSRLSDMYGCNTDKTKLLLRAVTEAGYAEYKGNMTWTLTERGWLISNSIIVALLETIENDSDEE